MAYNSQKSGFALLVSLVVVGSILSIGLVILDLSIKQVRLAASTKDSEVSFHAANAGMECARYWRRAESAAMETGGAINIDCYGESSGNVTANDGVTPTDSGAGDTYVYEYEFSWNGGERCSTVTSVVAVADIDGGGMSVTNMQDLILGYPTSDDLDCAAGGRCTVIATQGYNKPCSQITDFGTIQREILLKF